MDDRIKQLIKEANAAKEKGQWKKARDLLFEAWKMAKSGIKSPA